MEYFSNAICTEGIDRCNLFATNNFLSFLHLVSCLSKSEFHGFEDQLRSIDDFLFQIIETMILLECQIFNKKK
jgi:hypothetical protein